MDSVVVISRSMLKPPPKLARRVRTGGQRKISMSSMDCPTMGRPEEHADLAKLYSQVRMKKRPDAARALDTDDGRGRTRQPSGCSSGESVSARCSDPDGSRSRDVWDVVREVLAVSVLVRIAQRSFPIEMDLWCFRPSTWHAYAETLTMIRGGSNSIQLARRPVAEAPGCIISAAGHDAQCGCSGLWRRTDDVFHKSALENGKHEHRFPATCNLSFEY